MEPYTLAVFALIVITTMCLFLFMSDLPPEPEPPLVQSPRIQPTIGTPGNVDVIRRESARIRRTHPVLAQNVAVARLMRLEQPTDQASS
jgi:hypothetical protein